MLPLDCSAFFRRNPCKLRLLVPKRPARAVSIPALLALPVQGAKSSASVAVNTNRGADSYRDGKTAAPAPRRGRANVVKGPPDSVLSDFRHYRPPRLTCRD